MNETTPKVSVIVPVYKAEAYLHRCVDSLLAQTFQNFEILLVDDGSPDKSGEICDEYAKMDKRIRVFHKENGGVSSARQCGMDHAQGEYTIHADPDDWVDSTMLEELYRKAKEEDADMVICDFYEERKNKTIYVRQQPSSLDHETVLCELFQQLHGSCCNKLVKRACYREFGVRFPLELSYCEDLYVNACLLAHKMNVTYLPKAFYHYDQYTNENSLVHYPYIFILNQEITLASLFKTTLSSYIYEKIYPYLLRNQAEVILYHTEFSLECFLTDYNSLKNLLHKIKSSRPRKFYLWTAFHISPFSARCVHKYVITIKELVISQK